MAEHWIQEDGNPCLSSREAKLDTQERRQPQLPINTWLGDTSQSPWIVVPGSLCYAHWVWECLSSNFTSWKSSLLKICNSALTSYSKENTLATHSYMPPVPQRTYKKATSGSLGSLFTPMSNHAKSSSLCLSSLELFEGSQNSKVEFGAGQWLRQLLRRKRRWYKPKEFTQNKFEMFAVYTIWELY